MVDVSKDLKETYPIATAIKATTEIITLKNGEPSLFEPALIIVDEPWDISAVFMLPLQARARLRLRVTVSLTVAP
jgi:hypothetical protein